MFALIDTPDSGNIIHAAELLRALTWCDYLRTHANRLYAAAVVPETAGAVSLLSKISAGKLACVDNYTPREIAVKGWTGLTTPDSVRKAADLLVDYDWLRKDAPPSRDALGRGRPSERYMINPAAMKGGEI